MRVFSKDTLIKIVFVLFIFFQNVSISQTTFENINNSDIYMFLDELANNNIIQLNSAIKPYTKENIFIFLELAKKSNHLLNKRQIDELNYYHKKYLLFSDNTINKYSVNSFFTNNTVGYNLKRKEFKLSLHPIWGFSTLVNNNASFQHIYGGVSFNASYLNSLSFYSILVDNTMNLPFSLPSYFSKNNGGNYKLWLNNDFSESRGGLIYNWSWGSVGIIKDHIEWGDNYSSSNILSGRTPSFPLVKLNIKPTRVFDFNYFHGWLVSEVLDSTRSYYNNAGNFRGLYFNKYIAANMFSFYLLNNIYLSFGNSIIYSDFSGPHLAYFIPFLFYKSVDHTLNHNIDNQNSQMFLNFSSRSFKDIHLYGSLFIDEFQKNRINVDSLSNFFSYKLGVRLIKFPFKNFSNIIEFTRSTPMTYKHYNATTTFESNGYNLGHYLIDNSYEFFYSLTYKPFFKIKIESDFTYSFHGDDLEYSYLNDYHPVEIPILKNKTWDSKVFNFLISYRIFYNTNLAIGYRYSHVKGYSNSVNTSQYFLDKFSPEILHGKNNFLVINFNINY